MSERLDLALVRRGLARSRAEATRAVAEGRVSVDGAPGLKPGRRVAETAAIEVSDAERWVARSAHKLIAALDGFRIDPRGLLCLDVGASTGGFTQVLLERGAAEVIALDVGHGQLVPELRADARVRVVEGANARELTPGRLAELSGATAAPALAVVDVSFISLRMVLAPIASVIESDGAIVALIKPQFEVGRQIVREGLVPTREARHAAVRAVLASASELGMAIEGLIASPLAGTSGNLEYLCALRTSGAADPTQWESRLSELD